jgi:hypothetical protein
MAELNTTATSDLLQHRAAGQLLRAAGQGGLLPGIHQLRLRHRRQHRLDSGCP